MEQNSRFLFPPIKVDSFRNQQSCYIDSNLTITFLGKHTISLFGVNLHKDFNPTQGQLCNIIHTREKPSTITIYHIPSTLIKSTP